MLRKTLTVTNVVSMMVMLLLAMNVMVKTILCSCPAHHAGNTLTVM